MPVIESTQDFSYKDQFVYNEMLCRASSSKTAVYWYSLMAALRCTGERVVSVVDSGVWIKHL